MLLPWSGKQDLLGIDVGEISTVGHGPLHPAVVKDCLGNSSHVSPPTPLPRHGLLLGLWEVYLHLPYPVLSPQGVINTTRDFTELANEC